MALAQARGTDEGGHRRKGEGEVPLMRVGQVPDPAEEEVEDGAAVEGWTVTG